MTVNKFRHIAELDSVRGLAALSVVLSHAALATGIFGSGIDANLWGLIHHTKPDPLPIGATPLRLLFSANEVVILFFVLSGFVLSLPYWKGNRLSYQSFLIRRIFRLYIPYVGSISLAAIAIILLNPKPHGLNPWLAPFWNDPITPGYLFRHIWMDGTLNSHNLNFVTWSLIVEMHVSIIFPFLFLFVSWKPRMAAVVLLLASTVGYLGIRLDIQSAAIRVISQDMFFTFAFMAGALTARAWLSGRLKPIAGSRWMSRLILLASLLLYDNRMVGTITYYVWYLFVVAGSVGIIAIVAETSGYESFLRKRPFMWLGRISYSLYLVHPILLLAMAHTRSLSPIVIAVSMPILAGIIADIYQRLVEKPANQLGKRITRPPS